MSIKDKYNVKSIDSFQCKEWLLYKHYAKRIPSISYSFGLFENNILIGILTIGKPASKDLCNGVCGIKNTELVYELNRLCVNDGLEKNVLSYFVSQSLKQIKEDMILVSYSDSGMFHNGYIYQATNWIYTGATVERTDPEINGKHARHIKTDGSIKDRVIRTSKHRYVYFIGKNSKKLKKQLKYKTYSYPKGENKRYDASYKPNIQAQLF